MSGKYNSMKKEIIMVNKNQEEMRNTISKIKNTLAGITCRLDKAEDQISELEHKIERSTQEEQQNEKRLKNMRIV